MKGGTTMPGDISNMFPKRLKKVRQIVGWTLEELATKYNQAFGGGLNKGTLSKYETGRQEPSSGTLFNLAQVLGVSTDYLFGSTSRLGEHEPQGFCPHCGRNLKTKARRFWYVERMEFGDDEDRIVRSHVGEVEAERRPEDVRKESVKCDLCRSYFDTEDEARKFHEENVIKSYENVRR
jgi:transcriptional regulator with XRE-family HTH domain